jgi:RNA polymerase sigma-70 factor (ECF subfamily)
MQEAFLVAFRNIRSIDLTISFGGWLKRIVINRSLDVLRKRKPHVELVPELPDDMAEEPIVLPEETTVSEKIEKIRAAMQKLPEKYRVVLSLNLFEGFDHDEIGQILGVTASTSRAQLSRGRQKLLQAMSG